MAFYEVTGPVAATRQRGLEYRLELEQLLATVPADENVVISFRKVEVMTGSFTDEFLAKVLVARAAGLTGRAPVVLTGLSEETAEEVNLCLERRKAVAVSVGDGAPLLLGGDDTLKQTFDAAVRRGEFRASDLVDDLHTTSQNINNRLKKLVEGGALVRDRHDPEAGGREYRYRPPALSVDPCPG